MALKICVVSADPALARPSGSAEYLSHVAASLRDAGARVTLLIVNPPPPRLTRLRLQPRYLAAFDGIEAFATVGFGADFLPLRPSNWLAPLRRRLGRADAAPPPTMGWTLPPPDPAGLDWAARRVAALGADAVLLNYFNMIDLVPRLSARVATAILVHDVLRLRTDSILAVGGAVDFDGAMLARERAAFARADLCVAIKPSEAAAISTIAPGAQSCVAPFGVPIADWDLDAARPPRCVFVATEAAPNRDGLGWLLTEIWPRVLRRRPDASLRVIGRAAPPDGVSWPAGVERAGFVDDLDEEYRSAAVALAPLRFGSGVKIKVIEALAAGLPCVATAVAVDGIADVAPVAGQAATAPSPLFVADDAETFAALTVEALGHPSAAALRRAARAFAAARFARGQAGGDLVPALRAAIARRRADADSR